MNFSHEIKEARELPKAAVQEVGKTTKGFEYAQNDVKAPRHLDTIRQDLKGTVYPGTDVRYEKHVFRLNGEKVEGVFPVFHSKFDVALPKDLRMASDTEQFKYCTKALASRLERDPEFAKQFSERQKAQIKAGAPRISGLTWHHNEVPGKMQLVEEREHKCPHTGGRSIWGGGSDNR